MKIRQSQIPQSQIQNQTIENRKSKIENRYTAREVLQLEDDDLGSCSSGLGLASMAHETQYTRLFRS
ncbi:hypothetical protein [Phormidium nigroviride]|uniref:hypothetical protein n=1 Tax=Phormidium nigroviride TaxID=482564 RepID=UPI00031384CC